MSTGLDVVSLEDSRALDPSIVGKKAASLAALLGQGFAVPDGFVITVGARISEDGTFEPDVVEVIRGHLGQLGDAPVAVRSSGVGEDGDDASFAGLYETVLDVDGVDAVLTAIVHCVRSDDSARVTAYASHAALPVAALVQRMVPATAAGVALTADPLTGAHDTVLVSAVEGTGESLVAGDQDAEEWRVDARGARPHRGQSEVLSVAQARRIAGVARSIEEQRGVPQDVEWALEGDDLYVLQARPMTGLPRQVVWQAQQPGGWMRNFRLGEWIADPISPLFDTWLLPLIEQGLADGMVDVCGVGPTPPHHVTVNGWWFGSMNLLPPIGQRVPMLRRFARTLATRPRDAAMMLPPLARFGVERQVAAYRDRLLPEYRRAVDDARNRIDGLGADELITLVEQLGGLAGGYFSSITFVGGYAWKAELPLARRLKKWLPASLNAGHQDLLSGLGMPPAIEAHAVQCLDWIHPPLGEAAPTPGIDAGRADLAARRHTMEERIREHLSDRRTRRFNGLVQRARWAAEIREQQLAQFTLPWPVLRTAALRLGALLVQRDVIDEPHDVFFLTFDELRESLSRDAFASRRREVEQRRAEHVVQHRLAPPLQLGVIPRPMRAFLAGLESARVGEVPPDSVVGQPASPGRVTAVARVVHTLEDADRLGVGEVLVTSATAPAWTVVFGRAAAIVTDVGSIAAHASLIAREYGIPAVVGTGDGTARIADGTQVLVDGSAGYVRVLGYGEEEP